MAIFEADYDSGAFSLADILAIPDDVVAEMLDAEAEVVVAAHKASIRKLGLVDSGRLEGSIKAHRKRGKSGPEIKVYPSGKRGGKNSNNAVGFIHEVGAPGRHIAAKQWMRKANEECADEAIAAASAVYDKRISQKGL